MISFATSKALAHERLLFFSDAVMAIAITFLAFDLRLPAVPITTDEQFLEQLRALGPQYFAFVISFAVIAIYWSAHHRMFRFIKEFDSGLTLLNLLYLFFVVQLPFLASVLGSDGNLSSATALYAAGLTAMAVSSSVLWLYAMRRGLIYDELSVAFRQFIFLRSAVIGVVFAISIPIAFISPFLAELTWTLISVVFIAIVRLAHVPTQAPPEGA